MNNRHLKYTLLIGAALVLGACSSSPDDEDIALANQGPQMLYDKAKENLANGNFNGAAKTLSTLDSRYPFGPYSHQVQLDLIYAYYKTNDQDQALAAIDRFIRLNPNHSDVDYVYYMRGLVNMDAESNLFQDLMGIDRADRDPTKSREAFNDFRQLIEKFPDSKYAPDAQKRMVYIKNRLAKYELAIARYYMKRQAYVAAANRGKYVLENFQDTPHLQEALELMVECYEQLKLPELKEHTLRTLKLNFPNSQYTG
ncbi:outer membrane protein assembly factor BamD [Aliiglaciecola sp. CAU 1673]|uniref:outer membrane protein assembly factor BamD n=1 Tax=Aliiglaciecola sp. CAU 1673 TaxID=3032595 RepID=UPI0023DACC12|nr:outer membrane protein assembly factor BamD [Aliiglaciecola sp. CAU 1673]MDF2178202.1 outer membrane protein assembly factor BamD [Aliiglaciecola sp. CAU 1673]